MKKEKWEKVYVGNTRYIVSNLGNVYKVTTTKTEKLHFNNKMPYLYISDSPLHRVVAILFVKNPDNKPIINHKNGNKRDNRAVNLEWCTQKENLIHALDTGLRKTKYYKPNATTIDKTVMYASRALLEVRKLNKQKSP
jgi:hypothetical protein